jgi:hypothetical protein
MAKNRRRKAAPRPPRPRGLLVLNQKTQVFEDRRLKRAKHPHRQRDLYPDPVERPERPAGFRHFLAGV